MKTIIVGGGCAGLSAAYTLRKAGVDFTLYEASPYPGGRCRTVYEDGYQFHSGAGSTEPQWETTFRYLEELGLTHRLYSIQKQRYSFKKNGRRRTVNLVAPSQFETVQDLLDNHMNDIEGFHLAGEYLFPIACTEGAFSTGEQAAEEIIRTSTSLIP